MIKSETLPGDYQFLCAMPEFGDHSFWCIEDCSKSSKDVEYKASLSSFGVVICVTKEKNEPILDLHLTCLGEGCKRIGFKDIGSNRIEDTLHRIEESVLEFLHHKALFNYIKFRELGGRVS